jgi:hypothetical protein
VGYVLKKVKGIKDLQPGDHIAFHRSNSYKDATFWHHAIVEEINIDEKKYTVIEFTMPEEEKTRKIMRNEITFNANNTFRVDYDDPKAVSSTEATLKRARSKLGETKHKGYNLFNWNCEHFATWCKTGKEESAQVKTPKRLLLTILPGVLKGPAVWLFKNLLKINMILELLFLMIKFWEQ